MSDKIEDGPYSTFKFNGVMYGSYSREMDPSGKHRYFAKGRKSVDSKWVDLDISETYGKTSEEANSQMILKMKKYLKDGKNL